MNLIRIFALLTSFSAVEGSVEDRSLISDGPATDGTCGFDETEIRPLEGTPFEVGGFPAGLVCENIDVMLGQAVARDKSIRPQLGEGFLHAAAWDNNNKEDTLQCFYAKGYSKTYEGLGEGNCYEWGCVEKYRETIHGNYLVILFPDDYFSDDDFSVPNPNGLKTPGMYWMKGGTFQYEIDDGENWNITKATGSYYDVCAAMTESGCGQFTKKGKCKRNGCEWNADTDECGEPSGGSVASAKQSVGKAAAVKEPMSSSHSAGVKARALISPTMMIIIMLWFH